jgi:hypothetical protein
MTTIVVTPDVTFYVNGNVTIEAGSTLDLTESKATFIDGDLKIVSSAAIIVGIKDFQHEPIVINNCGYFDGNLTINITENISAIQNDTERNIFSAACIQGNFSFVNIVYGSQVNETCISAEPKYRPTSLSLVFRFNSNCTGNPADSLLEDEKSLPIIGGVVAAGILGLVIILFILSLAVESLRRRIYPHQFTKRFESSAVKRHRSSMHLKTRGSRTELDLVEPAAEPARNESMHRTRSQARLDNTAVTAQAAAEAKFMEKVSRGNSSNQLRVVPLAPGPDEPVADQVAASSDASVNLDVTV